MFEKKCSCEQGYHRAPLQSVDIGRGVIAKLPEVLADYQSIYLVADERTYAIAGETAEQLLKEAGKNVHHYILEKVYLLKLYVLYWVILEKYAKKRIYIL